MPDRRFASLSEDLTDAPLHQELQGAIRTMIERGTAPADVVDAALATFAAFSLDVDGIEKTAVRMIAAAQSLLNAAAPSQDHSRIH